MNTSANRFLRLALFLCGTTIVGLAIWSFLIEPNRLVVHSEDIEIRDWPSKLNGIKIAALGDIHAGSLFIDEHKLHEIVRVTNEQHPDLIVLLGDYMVQDHFYRLHIPPETIASALKELRAPLGIYAVLGNHDWWFDGEKVRQALESVGIHVLDNEVAELSRDGYTFWVVGFADAWTRSQNIPGLLSLVPADALVIGVTHNPDIFVGIPPRVALVLAAHTHGGQVNLPSLGRLVVPSAFGQRFAAGHIEENGHHLFVTTGIGTSIMPVRFRVPPEIAVLTVKSR